MMTPKERYEAVLAGGEFDYHARIPIVMQFAAEYVGSNYAAFASDHRVLVEANIRCAEDFGFEQVSTISDPYRETAGFGAEMVFHEHAVPECVRVPLGAIEEVAKLVVPDPWEAPRMRDRLEAVRLYRKRVGGQYSILGWVEGPAALAADVRGVEDFLVDLMEEPEACGALMDLCAETGVAFAQAQIEAGADTVGIGDAVCSQISPEVYGEWVFPRQKRLVEGIRGAGGRVRLHICGQTKHLWRWLRELAVDIFDCDHMVPMAQARAALGEGVVLAGNLDPVGVLCFGRAEAIRPLVEACREAAGPRYLVCAGCEVPALAPRANLRELCRPLGAAG